MRINGVKYPKKFVRMIRALRAIGWPTYNAGCFLALMKVPAGDAMCLLNMRSV